MILFPFLSKFASIDNLGVTTSAIGDYTTPANFSVGPPADEVWNITRMIVFIEDTGAFTPNKYGFLTALTVGINLGVYRAGVLKIDLLNGLPVKQNNHWKRQCYDISHDEFGNAQATESLGVRWTFQHSGVPISLDGDQTDQIRVVMADNLTGLIAHTFLFQGHKVQPDYRQLKL